MRTARDNDVETSWRMCGGLRWSEPECPFLFARGAHGGRFPTSLPSGVGAMTPRISWQEASARRLERQFLANPLADDTGGPVEIVAAMLGAHAQVPSAAEPAVGIRAEGTTRTGVRAAPAGDRSLVRTHGPRGTVHLLPARELPLWTAALTAVPSGRSPFPPDVRLTSAQAEQVVAAIGEALEGVCLTVEELDEEVVARTGPWAGDLVMPAGWPGRPRPARPPLPRRLRSGHTAGLRQVGGGRGHRVPRRSRARGAVAALCCSRVPPTGGRRRAGRPGTSRCCWWTGWRRASGTSGAGAAVRPSRWSRWAGSRPGGPGSSASAPNGSARCWRRRRSW